MPGIALRLVCLQENNQYMPNGRRTPVEYKTVACSLNRNQISLLLLGPNVLSLNIECKGTFMSLIRSM